MPFGADACPAVRARARAGKGERDEYAQYEPSLEERLALTAYIEARRSELEARAMRLWLKQTRQETVLRSALLLLKPAVTTQCIEDPTARHRSTLQAAGC